MMYFMADFSKEKKEKKSSKLPGYRDLAVDGLVGQQAVRSGAS